MSSLDRLAAPTPAETARRTKSPMPPSRSRSPPARSTHLRRRPSTVAASSCAVARASCLFASSAMPEGYRGHVDPVRYSGVPWLGPLSPVHRLLRDHPGRAVVLRARRSPAAFAAPEAIERLTLAKHRSNARRIEAAILRLRGLFIKVGQLISIMANFLPDAFREELQRLQDQVPPRPYRDIEARLREEFGGRGADRAVRRVLARAGRLGVDRPGPPRAAAQRARRSRSRSSTRTSRRSSASTCGRCAASSRCCAGSCPTTASTPSTARSARWCWPSSTTGGRRPPSRRSPPTSPRASATNVRFPRVMAEFSTARVLTTEWMEGTKVARPRAARRRRRSIAGGGARSASRPTASRSSSTASTTPIRTPGTCWCSHRRPRRAQPPTIVFLDFGATATVSEGMRRGMVSFLQGAITRDTDPHRRRP